jgi:hypothetical protein
MATKAVPTAGQMASQTSTLVRRDSLIRIPMKLRSTLRLH